jgi:hypothetical protein
LNDEAASMVVLRLSPAEAKQDIDRVQLEKLLV